MKWEAGIFGVLVAILIVFWGGLMAAPQGLIPGGGSPEFGIPAMVIGAVLFIFILGASWAVAATQTFVIIVGAILLVIGVSWETDPWPGFIFIVSGVVLASLVRPVANLIARTMKYLWATKYGRIITMAALAAMIVYAIMLIGFGRIPWVSD